MNNGIGRLKTSELIPGLGVKVDVDIAGVLTDSVKQELKWLFDQHHLLFIEAPNLSSELQLEVMEIFGTVIPASMDGKLEMLVSNTHPDGYLGKYEVDWHIDGSFMPEPFRLNCLYAMELEDGKSSTQFVSAATAVDRLPKDLRDKLHYLQVINTVESTTQRGKRVETHGSDLIAAAHRIISSHPVTGIPYLAANAYQTDCIIGLNGEESNVLLQEVYRHMYSPETVYEHWWNKGELVIWDNLIVQHARGDVSNVGNRTLRRFTVGPATNAEQLPERQRDMMLTNMLARIGPKASPKPELVQA